MIWEKCKTYKDALKLLEQRCSGLGGFIRNPENPKPSKEDLNRFLTYTDKKEFEGFVVMFEKRWIADSPDYLIRNTLVAMMLLNFLASDGDDGELKFV